MWGSNNNNNNNNNRRVASGVFHSCENFFIFRFSMPLDATAEL